MSERVGSTVRSDTQIPRKIFIFVAGSICLGLAFSALLTFMTLGSLKQEFLEARGRDIVSLVERQVRGPGRRSNPELWQQTLQETLASNQDSLAFLLLKDSQGRTVASAGELSGTDQVRGTAVTVSGPLTAPRGPRWESGQGQGTYQGAPAQLEVGLWPGATRFITRQAYVQLAVSGAAILLLVGLTAYFLRTLDRYLALRALEASQRQLAQLGQMAATLAHEIRNPLGAMKGLTQLVQEGLDDQDQNRELTRTVVSEAERLENLVADLLTYARPRPLESTTVDLDALVSDVCQFLSGRALEAEVTLSQDNRGSGFAVAADSDGIRQVLLNVMANAIDAAPRGTRVDVILSDHGSAIWLEVLDRGSGLGSINPEELFQPFKTTKIKGSGLGLAISRQIVEALGGTIILEDRPDGGAVCRVSLPCG